MSDLFTGVVSIVPTRRRRFFWAAWWSGPPAADPFRAPDGSSGGARTREEARSRAEETAGQRLVEIDGRWAGAWVRVLRGDPPWPKERANHGEARVSAAPSVTKGSRAWALSVLGLAAGATADEVKRAFKLLAQRTHPDRGGDDAAFIEAKRAHDAALAAADGKRRRRR